MLGFHWTTIFDGEAKCGKLVNEIKSWRLWRELFSSIMSMETYFWRISLWCQCNYGGHILNGFWRNNYNFVRSTYIIVFEYIYTTCMFGNIWIMNQGKQGAPPFERGSNSVGVFIQLDILQLIFFNQLGSYSQHLEFCPYVVLQWSLTISGCRQYFTWKY